MSVMSTPAIEAIGLSYVRNGEHLFENFSFSVKKGSYTAVIGPNGGGKTTLMRVLLGLLPSTSGSVQIFGRSNTTRDVRRRIGYVPQRGGLIEPTFPATSQEIVMAGRTQILKFWNRLGPSDQQAVNTAFEIMSISHLRNRTFASLSGGERQRVLLARALAAEPDILILDEPVDGLDPDSREEFYEALRHVNAQGKTILFVSHDVHRLAKEADSAICLRHELVCHGSKACMLTGTQLHDLYHPTKSELIQHHGI
ncbi:TPA: hypothetical protein DCW61_02360 [Candidatus Uhrbacteria bacterium]|nr:hypothetical protein [Candidatus Uhrbacteria bacterium]